jgi:hypothetical protein
MLFILFQLLVCMVDYEAILEINFKREAPTDLVVDNTIDNIEFKTSTELEKYYADWFKSHGLFDKRVIIKHILNSQSDYILRCMKNKAKSIDLPKLGRFIRTKGKEKYYELECKYGKDDRESINRELNEMRDNGEFLRKRKKIAIISVVPNE